VSIYTPTLHSFAALLEPFFNFISDISWVNGEPTAVMIDESAFRLFGPDWYPNHPLWELFDALDLFGIGYGFEVETVA
jgi:hypothetical protein